MTCRAACAALLPPCPVMFCSHAEPSLPAMACHALPPCRRRLPRRSLCSTTSQMRSTPSSSSMAGGRSRAGAGQRSSGVAAVERATAVEQLDAAGASCAGRLILLEACQHIAVLDTAGAWMPPAVSFNQNKTHEHARSCCSLYRAAGTPGAHLPALGDVCWLSLLATWAVYGIDPVQSSSLDPSRRMATLVVSVEEILAGKLGKEESRAARKWVQNGEPLYKRPGNLVVVDNEGVDMRVSAVGWSKRRRRTSGGHLLPGVPPRDSPGTPRAHPRRCRCRPANPPPATETSPVSAPCLPPACSTTCAEGPSQAGSTVHAATPAATSAPAAPGSAASALGESV